jgi:hypothetical protein
MAWKTMDVREQRVRFVVAAARKEKPMAKLCQEFEISRPTGYLWSKRYEEAGLTRRLFCTYVWDMCRPSGAHNHTLSSPKAYALGSVIGAPPGARIWQSDILAICPGGVRARI